MPYKYSFIIPIYNEEETLPEMYHRLSVVADRMDGLVELIFINDGSRDRSVKIIRELARTYQSLAQVISTAFEQIDELDMYNWFTHCCYCSSPT